MRSAAIIVAAISLAPIGAEPSLAAGPGIEFIRGECNGDGGVDVADAISVLGFLFGGGGAPLACELACDANGDDGIDIADAIYTLAYLFQGTSPPPPAPFPDCGTDPTATLGCSTYPPCSPSLPLPGFGDLSGDIDVLEPANLASASPAYFTTTLDFGTDPFDAPADLPLLTAGGQAIHAAGSGAGSALLAEVFAFEGLARGELAELVKTKDEILYLDPSGTKTDMIVEIDGVTLGVAVARAFGFPPLDPYTIAQANDLLDVQLNDILESSANVAPVDAWQKQLLVLTAYAPGHEQSLFAAWGALDPSLRADTILIVVVTEGDDAFLY